MQNEDFMRRPPSRVHYRPVPALLVVPPGAVRATHNLLQRAGDREACAFWYGERDGHVSRVLSVRSPEQASSRGNYHVEAEAMSQLVRDLPGSWRPLAQIHSHPGIDTEHSRYDDRMVSSRKILSIVFPAYGLPIKPWPIGLGVHEWQDEYWHLLTPDQTENRLALDTDIDVDVRDFR
ncbi:Mov34/MPN/PAD-1 family protein [Rhizobium brockwellii]|uniref:Mov34/MPN/PAD-1 family protein n=1 Tax=Rhizobium brockwellii TaxID=3019932 RepID=A0ABU3YY50_9HYPH|nr:Mov34/MPN/PAD-1 family protein [Rhizobium brockwellii]MDV4183789.1 Mov34/MPN/PAD-1 family protein [Rhizobium brockwellii]MDV4190785.1 Mov34/MPN/PAD-1 family protein [Rhizobium brockwellii]